MTGHLYESPTPAQSHQLRLGAGGPSGDGAGARLPLAAWVVPAAGAPAAAFLASGAAMC